ncbi:unnamed protein product [Periconia digitata]|uniref:ATP synthase regulation protein NCA2 n=1 Tax=Periconia digitata TaxID=1303443 RepID=A0A9W4URS3_9PLEO|nr:unnamed protein product [Periconia digitata]
MSFVVDQVRRIDAQLDRLQLSTSGHSVVASSLSTDEIHDPQRAGRIAHLQRLIKSLSAANSAKAKNALVPSKQIQAVLEQAGLSSASNSTGCTTCRSLFEEQQQQQQQQQQRHHDDYSSSGSSASSSSSYEHELEWLLLSKATTQAYGSVLSTILDQTIPLEDDIWYWDDIVSTYRFAGLYSIQTSPIRLYNWSKDIYRDVTARGGRLATDSWREFYGLVGEAVRDRSIADIRRKVVGPLALVRNEGRRKTEALKRIKTMNANALGVLLGEGLSNESMHEDGFQSPSQYGTTADKRHRWKSTVAKSIALMDAVLHTVKDSELPIDKFDDAVAATTHEDLYYELHESSGERTATSLRPADAAARLHNLLAHALPQYSSNFNAMVRENGRPSRLVRYWLPMTLALVSSTTILRIITTRREQILTWIRDLGHTVLDFYTNWILDPTKKIIATIRHNEDSEVSILSKRSLESDRASLERMVVDFAVAHPEGTTTLTETQISELRAKVREGDLTPVLKAYEKDIQSPVKGAIMGNLASALLIQVQKTKVDVEVAMSGIDSILKSQELLFGFIGLTPGLLISLSLYRSLTSLLTTRKGLTQFSHQTSLLLILRNIDRILVGASPTEFGEMSYRDHGLLLCEVHLLRQAAGQVLPRRVFADFLVEMDELVDVRVGLERQMKVVERVRWAYGRWFTK